MEQLLYYHMLCNKANIRIRQIHNALLRQVRGNKVSRWLYIRTRVWWAWSGASASAWPNHCCSSLNEGMCSHGRRRTSGG